MSPAWESGMLQHKIEKPSLSENLNQILYASNTTTSTTTPHKKHSDFFSSLSSESKHMCIDCLGVERFDSNNASKCWESDEKKEDENFEKSLGLKLKGCCSCDGELRLSRVEYPLYPPPISCIGRNGKPRVSFVACKDNGRFVLKGIRTPMHELLHAIREDGRLRLHFLLDNEAEEEIDYDNDGECGGGGGDHYGEEDHIEVESVDLGEEGMGKANDESVS